MPTTMQQLVPPWVFAFSRLGVGQNVEILEMSHPRLTGLAGAEQPIEDRMGYTVFLLRRAIPVGTLQTLSELAPNTFKDIQTNKTTTRGTQVGCQSCHAWQAVEEADCSCKYKYAGTNRHTLYHRTPQQVFETVWRFESIGRNQSKTCWEIVSNDNLSL